MYKLPKSAIVAIAALTIISCATTDQVVYHVPAGCSPNNVVIKVELDQANSVPMLNDKAQRVVCINAGSSVTWIRSNVDGNKNFTIFFKDSSVEIPSSSQGKATYTAPTKVPSIDALSYGIRMPDAVKELDPIIVIIPSFNQQ
ncbi:MAG: hypothetical protein IMF09_03935 [Proteobacteria bacterium]|nr:hypothetical protein [Pseudomonadota bacterium]